MKMNTIDIMEQLNSTYIIRINGLFADAANATVNLFDHGFLFGDSVYEVIRTVGDKILGWNEHLERLHNSAQRLRLRIPWTDSELKDEIDATLAERTWDGDSFVRLIITRGIGNLELSPESCEHPNLYILAKSLPKLPRKIYDEGIAMCLTKVRRNSIDAMDPGIKSGNYLNNVLAVIEAKERGADDAFMLNEHGYLTEASNSNIHLIKNGKVLTPSLDCGLLAGITRRLLFEILAVNNIPVIEGKYTVDDILGADEIFISSSIRGIAPVKSVCGEISWNRGAGPMTRKIRDLYETAFGIVP